MSESTPGSQKKQVARADYSSQGNSQQMQSGILYPSTSLSGNRLTNKAPGTIEDNKNIRTETEAAEKQGSGVNQSDKREGKQPNNSDSKPDDASARQKQSPCDGGQASPSDNPGSTGDSHDGSIEQPVTGKDQETPHDLIGKPPKLFPRSSQLQEEISVGDPQTTNTKRTVHTDSGGYKTMERSTLHETPTQSKFTMRNSYNNKSFQPKLKYTGKGQTKALHGNNNQQSAASIRQSGISKHVSLRGDASNYRSVFDTSTGSDKLKSNGEYEISKQGRVWCIRDLKTNKLTTLKTIKANEVFFESKELVSVDGVFHQLIVHNGKKPKLEIAERSSSSSEDERKPNPCDFSYGSKSEDYSEASTTLNSLPESEEPRSRLQKQPNKTRKENAMAYMKAGARTVLFTGSKIYQEEGCTDARGKLPGTPKTDKPNTHTRNQDMKPEEGLSGVDHDKAKAMNKKKRAPRSPSAEQTSGQQSADDTNKGSPRTGAEVTGDLDDAGNQLGMGEGTGTNAGPIAGNGRDPTKPTRSASPDIRYRQKLDTQDKSEKDKLEKESRPDTDNPKPKEEKKKREGKVLDKPTDTLSGYPQRPDEGGPDSTQSAEDSSEQTLKQSATEHVPEAVDKTPGNHDKKPPIPSPRKRKQQENGNPVKSIDNLKVTNIQGTMQIDTGNGRAGSQDQSPPGAALQSQTDRANAEKEVTAKDLVKRQTGNVDDQKRRQDGEETSDLHVASDLPDGTRKHAQDSFDWEHFSATEATKNQAGGPMKHPQQQSDTDTKSLTEGYAVITNQPKSSTKRHEEIENGASLDSSFVILSKDDVEDGLEDEGKEMLEFPRQSQPNAPTGLTRDEADGGRETMEKSALSETQIPMGSAENDKGAKSILKITGKESPKELQENNNHQSAAGISQSERSEHVILQEHASSYGSAFDTSAGSDKLKSNGEYEISKKGRVWCIRDLKTNKLTTLKNIDANEVFFESNELVSVDGVFHQLMVRTGKTPKLQLEEGSSSSSEDQDPDTCEFSSDKKFGDGTKKNNPRVKPIRLERMQNDEENVLLDIKVIRLGELETWQVRLPWESFLLYNFLCCDKESLEYVVSKCRTIFGQVHVNEKGIEIQVEGGKKLPKINEIVSKILHIYQSHCTDKILFNRFPVEGCDEKELFDNVQISTTSYDILIWHDMEGHFLYLGCRKSCFEKANSPIDSVILNTRKRFEIKSPESFPDSVLRMIKHDVFKQQFSRHFPDVKFSIHQGVIKFSGIAEKQVIEARTWFDIEAQWDEVEFAKINKRKKVANLSSIVERFLETEYGKCGTVFWDIDQKRDRVIVCCLGEPSQSKIRSSIENLIKEDSYSFSYPVTEDQWQQITFEIEENYSDVQYTRQSDNKITLYGISMDIKHIKEFCERLNENMKTDWSEEISGKSTDNFFVLGSEKGKQILKKNHVRNASNQNTVKLCGLKSDVEMAIKEIEALRKEVVEHKLTCNVGSPTEVKQMMDQIKKDMSIDVSQCMGNDDQSESTASEEYLMVNGSSVELQQSIIQKSNLVVNLNIMETGKFLLKEIEICSSKLPSNEKECQLDIPMWCGGQNKEMESIDKNTKLFFEKANRAHCFKICVLVPQQKVVGYSKLMKRFVWDVFDCLTNQKPPMKITFICRNAADFNEWRMFLSNGAAGQTTILPPEIDDETDTSIKVSVIQGNLHETVAEVIVNTVSENLDLDKGFISKSLLHHAGTKLQDAEKQKKKWLSFWKFIETPAFDLKQCQCILHCAIEPLSNEKGVFMDTAYKGCLEKLQKMVLKLLEKADSLNFSSIALPALATGNLAYPAQDVAEAIFNAIQQFSKNRKTLNKVYIVIHRTDVETFKVFHQEQECRKADQKKDRKQSSTALQFGNTCVKAVRGPLGSVHADVLCYFWDTRFLTDVNKTHPLLNKMNDGDQRKFFKKRDANKKKELKEFDTDGSHVNCRTILHYPCSEADLSEAIKSAVKLTDEKGSQSMSICLDEFHSFASQAPNIAVELIEYIGSNWPSRFLRNVTVHVETPNLFTKIAQVFEERKPATPKDSVELRLFGFRSDVDKAIARIKKQENIQVVNKETLTRADGEHEDVASKYSMTGARPKEKLSQLPKEQTKDKNWNKELLNKSPTANIVCMENISADASEEALTDSLKRVSKGNFNLLHCAGDKTALVVFETLNDAEKAMKRKSKFCTFRSCDSQPLYNVEFLIDCQKMEEMGNGLNELQAKLTGPCFSCKVTEQGLHVTSLVMYGYNYVQNFIQKPKVEEKKFNDVKPFVWNTLKDKFEEDFEQIRKEQGNVRYDEKKQQIIIKGSKKVFEGLITDFENYVTRLINCEAELEFCFKDEDLSKAGAWCQDIEDAFNSKVICFVEHDMKMIVVFVDKYDYVKSLKIKVPQIMKGSSVKNTGRAKRIRHMQAVKSTDSPRVSTFSWDRDAKNVRKYTVAGCNVTVFAYQASICNVPVDCIVNAANERLAHDGGVARVIADAAGPQLEEEGNALVRGKPVPVGCAVATTAGKLHYKWVIHTVGPRWSAYDTQSAKGVEQCRSDLRKAIVSSFALATEKNMESIALPAISSAIFGVPLAICVKEYAIAIKEFCLDRETSLKKIHFIDIVPETVRNIQNAFEIELNKNLQCQSQTEVNKNKKLSIRPKLQTSAVESTDTEKKFVISSDENDIFTVIVCWNDICNVKADAVVVTVDKSGRLGLVGQSVQRQMKDSSQYRTEVSVKMQGKDFPGFVFDTGGNRTGFDRIVHVVLSRSDTHVQIDDRCKIITTAYDSLFRSCLDDASIHSLSTVVFGVEENEVGVGTRVLWECLVKLAGEMEIHKQLTVYLVCKMRKLYQIVGNTLKTLAETIPGMDVPEDDKKQKDGIPDKEKAGDAAGEKCVICMDDVTDPKWRPCNHVFCTHCIEMQFKFKEACPTCGAVVGIITGNQPNGRMTVWINRYRHCSGYPNDARIEMKYEFSDGTQKDEHPDPGKAYMGISRTGYLPGNERGRTICKMMKVAFERRLIFTIGNSRTTGREGVITWNDIHHKTDPRPNSQFGYPDPTYFDRVTDELAAKGVTEKDVQRGRMLESTLAV